MEVALGQSLLPSVRGSIAVYQGTFDGFGDLVAWNEPSRKGLCSRPSNIAPKQPNTPNW